jgi:sterol desaturase/sphingolipid hydroxylase (fatty acid hydroxylase superfamily)
LNQWAMPTALQVLLSMALLDYTLYIWHVLSHKVPLLWRCHVVHHIDLDLDASTAIRFHFSELALSVLWRVLQVRCLGINPGALSLWQTFLMFNILFHHSNVKLPLQFEVVLNWLVVTPRMHGIHHSIIEAETNANWSSGLTLWDRVHHTYRMDIPQDNIVIGVPAYRLKEEVGLWRMLILPFVSQPPIWLLRDHSKPVRTNNSHLSATISSL